MKNLKAIQLMTILSVIVVFTQVSTAIAQEEEILQVRTELAQISIAIEQTVSEPFQIEVSENQMPLAGVTFDAPAAAPLELEIVVAFNPLLKGKINADELNYQLKALRSRSLHLSGIGIVDDEGGLGQSLKFPKDVTVGHFPELDAAINRSVARLQPARRRALLILTNEIESLPGNIIRRTSEKLGQSAMMVYLMSVNEKDVKRRIISQCNVNGRDIVVFKHDFLAGLFRSFSRLANSLYTVSYPLPEEAGAAEAVTHKIAVVARRVSDQREIAKNVRSFVSPGSSAAAASPSIVKASFGAADAVDGSDETGDDEVINEAVKSIARTDFDRLLSRRQAKLTAVRQDFYLAELRARPELKTTVILEASDTRLQKLQSNLAPVLKIYGRENYTRIFVYEGANPFVGLYRECILIFSTKALELLNDEQLRAAAAHELAHEIFITELLAADRANDNRGRHLVEHQCDLVAAEATCRLGDDSFAVARAAEIFADFYRKNLPGTDIGADRAPSSAARFVCIKSFLRAICPGRTITG